MEFGSDACKKIANILRRLARQELDKEDLPSESRDCADLVNVLARLLEGKTLYQAFGAPGDWGYGTEIGQALAEAYRA